MKTWAALAQALVSLVGALVAYLNSRQLLDAGARAALADQLQGILDNVAKARDAADAVDPDSDTFDDDYAARVKARFRRGD